MHMAALNGVEKHDAHVFDTSRTHKPSAHTGRIGQSARVAFISDSAHVFLERHRLTQWCAHASLARWPLPVSRIRSPQCWLAGRQGIGGWDNAMHVYRRKRHPRGHSSRRDFFASNGSTMLSMLNELAVATTPQACVTSTRERRNGPPKGNLEAGTDVHALLLTVTVTWFMAAMDLCSSSVHDPNNRYRLMNPLPAKANGLVRWQQ